MSRIGKKPIEIPKGVEVEIQGQNVLVKGPKGELGKAIPEEIQVVKQGSELVCAPRGKLSQGEAKKAGALWGLSRSLLFNMIEGVTKGYEKKLEIEGTGYKASAKEDSLNLSLGFSHPVQVQIPQGMSCSVDKNLITIMGIDKEKVGEFAAKVRRLRPAEPYKGKGIKYEGEQIRRKEGKKVVATTGAA